MKSSDLTPIQYKNSSTSTASSAGKELGRSYRVFNPGRSFDTIFSSAKVLLYNRKELDSTYRLFFIAGYNNEFVNMLTKEHLLLLGFSEGDIPKGLE